MVRGDAGIFRSLVLISGVRDPLSVPDSLASSRRTPASNVKQTIHS